MMSDKKISQLTAATTPLAGTEVLPIVQSSTTVKASIANIQAAPVAAGLANGVQYLNASKVPSTIANFSYDNSKLTIQDQLLVSTSQTKFGDNGIIGGGAADANTALSYFGGKNLFIKESASTRVTVAAGGNVGVGTSSPTTKMHLAQSNAGTYASVILLSNSADAAGDRTGIYGSSSVGVASPYRGGITFWPGASGAVAIHTGNNATPGAGEAMYFAGTGARDVTVSTGNLVIGTAGKGIDFSADGQAAGMTSELLDDYEEGTWTPTDGSGAGLTFTDTSNNCFYTKIGNVVTACFNVTYPSTADGSFARIAGLPFTSKATTGNPQGGFFSEQTFSAGATISISANASSFIVLTSGTVSIATNANLSTKTLKGVVVYQV
jgi:hypothetical protein